MNSFYKQHSFSRLDPLIESNHNLEGFNFATTTMIGSMTSAFLITIRAFCVFGLRPSVVGKGVGPGLLVSQNLLKTNLYTRQDTLKDKQGIYIIAEMNVNPNNLSMVRYS